MFVWNKSGGRYAPQLSTYHSTFTGIYLTFYGRAPSGTNNFYTTEYQPGGGGILWETAGTWHHLIGTMNTNHATGLKKASWYFDNTPGTLNPNGSYDGGSAAFTMTMNGVDCYIGDDTFGENYVGDMADLSMWPGVSFFNAGETAIDSATLQLFRTVGGKPVDPAVAIAALGTPAVMLTGGASTFANNSLGSGGAFSVDAGTLTDAATAP